MMYSIPGNGPVVIRAVITPIVFVILYLCVVSSDSPYLVISESLESKGQYTTVQFSGYTTFDSNALKIALL
jgi:hypothetical protein